MGKSYRYRKDGASMAVIRGVCEGQKRVQGLGTLNLDLPFTGTGPTITNIVCGVNLNCLLELRMISLLARNVYYRPKRFPAAVMRIREPKATGLLFKSGKVQLLGTRSVDDAHLAARKIACKLAKLGYRPVLSGFTVQNIVANADFEFPIHLEGIALRLRAHTNYEPEIFPGLAIYIEQPKITGLMFAKGKVVLLGSKAVEDTEKALQMVWLLAMTFKKTKGHGSA